MSTWTQKVRLQAQLNNMYQPSPRAGWLRHSWPKDAVVQDRGGWDSVIWS